MLSPSKHEIPFFSTLLALIIRASREKLDAL